jgi:hypothetical protein
MHSQHIQDLSMHSPDLETYLAIAHTLHHTAVGVKLRYHPTVEALGREATKKLSYYLTVI